MNPESDADSDALEELPAGDPDDSGSLQVSPVLRMSDSIRPGRVSTETVTVRRSPRFIRFMVVFSGLFAIVAFVLTYSRPEVQTQGDVQGADRNAVFGFLLLVAIALGVTVGSIVALIAERISRRSIRVVRAHRTDTRRPVDEREGDPLPARHDAEDLPPGLRDDDDRPPTLRDEGDPLPAWRDADDLPPGLPDADDRRVEHPVDGD